MKYLLTCFSLIISFTLLAQKSKLTGKLLDEKQSEPLAYATVVVLEPSSENVVTSGVTDFDGNFSIKVESGQYDIKFEYISYDTKYMRNIDLSKDKNLGNIVLKFSQNELDEVTVVAETTELEVRLDKKIYTLGKDLTVAGGTVTDALENVPSVTVDVEGAISLRGNENVRILINGKPSALAGFGSTDVLQQLPADAIEKVEVITSPSARYDAQGTAGIINIVLKREKTLGFNGSVRLEAGDPLNNRAAANLNLRTEKFNIFGNFGYSHRKPPGNAFFDNTFTSGQFDRVIEDRTFERNRKDFNYNLGMTYYFDYMTSITGSFFGRGGDDEDFTNNINTRFIDGEVDSETIREEFEVEDESSYQVSLNFEKKFNDDGHELKADIQYSEDEETALTNITENQTSPTFEFLALENIIETEDETEFLIQSDYVKPMGEAQFEAGFRITLEENINDFFLEEADENGDLQVNQQLTNEFTFDENVYAVYSQYGNKFGKFSFLLGLRYENTQLKGETVSEFDITELEELLGEDVDLNFDNTFEGLFPTVNLIYELGEDENVTLGYNRRINRPRGFFLNPFPSRSSRTNIFQGNPSLNPAFANAFDLGYLKRWGKKITLTSSIYYQRETDAFERVQEETGQVTQDGISVLRTIPINLSTNERIGGEIGVLYNPFKWLSLNTSGNFFRFETEGFFNGTDFGATNESLTARFSSKVTLPYKVQWQTNINYRGPTENSQTETDPITTVNLALSKDILNDNATISLNVRDLFNDRVRDQFTQTEFFTSDSQFQWRERQITATFIYRFNQNKKRNGGDRGDGDYDADGGY